MRLEEAGKRLESLRPCEVTWYGSVFRYFTTLYRLRDGRIWVTISFKITENGKMIEGGAIVTEVEVRPASEADWPDDVR